MNSVSSRDLSFAEVVVMCLVSAAQRQKMLEEIEREFEGISQILSS